MKRNLFNDGRGWAAGGCNRWGKAYTVSVDGRGRAEFTGPVPLKERRHVMRIARDKRMYMAQIRDAYRANPKLFDGPTGVTG